MQIKVGVICRSQNKLNWITYYEVCIILHNIPKDQFNNCHVIHSKHFHSLKYDPKVFHCLKNSRWKQNFLRCERSHEKISPALQARELWEHPFQACAIDTIDADCALRSETGCAEFGFFFCYFKMDAPRTLVFRPLVKGNETLGKRLQKQRRNEWRNGG